MTIKIDESNCTGCGVCVNACPIEALKIENNKVLVSDECSGCGICQFECASNAISL